MSEQQIVTHSPFTPTSLEQAETMAKWIADSGCFGIKKHTQALTVMMIANSEGQTIAQALKRYHVFDDGKLSQRSDYTQAEFEKRGTIIWHLRTEEVVAATFFRSKEIDDKARERARSRFKAQYELNSIQLLEAKERNRKREAELIELLADLSHEGEATIIRTIADAESKGITQGKNGTKTNWSIGAANMLQWRCVSDGVKLVDPSAYSGVTSDVEMQDVKIIEQKNQLQIAQSAYDPKSRDREAMQLILEEHLRNAQEATTPAQRQHYQGLASEMRVKIADLETKPAIIAETEVIPPGGSLHEDDQLPGVVVEADWRKYRIRDIKALEGKPLGELSAEEVQTLYIKRSKYADHPKYGEEVKWITRAYTELFPAEP